MNITISINMDNAAFDDDSEENNSLNEQEVYNVMQKCKDAVLRLAEEGGTKKIFDSNGNSIGTVKVDV